MRSLLIVPTLLLAPAGAFAASQCAIDLSGPRPVTRLPLALVDAPVLQPKGDLPPALSHVVGAGATLTELGNSHGFRSVIARTGEEFMFLHSAPDGEAVVAGMLSEMTPEQLLAAAPGQTRELGVFHGLRSLFVSNGGQFQVFYVSPDGQRVVPGAMWDSAGKNLTREQVRSVPGAIATVEIRPRPPGEAAGPTLPAGSILSAVQATSSGPVGDASAPKAWMFVDPMCSFSVRAMKQLEPLVRAGRLQLEVIPLAILDHEDAGRSTTSALAMLSMQPSGMVKAWEDGKLDEPATPDAPLRLAANRAASEAIGLRGTPTLVWRKADGTDGRSDGMPADVEAMIVSMAR